MADKIKKIRGRWWVMFLAVAVLGGVVWCLNLYGHHRETVNLTKAGSKEVIVIDPGTRWGRSGESGGGRKSGKRCESCHRKKTCPVYAEKRLYRIYDQRRGRYADKRGDPQQKDAGSDCQSRKNQGMGSGSCYIDSPEQLSKGRYQEPRCFITRNRKKEKNWQRRFRIYCGQVWSGE